MSNKNYSQVFILPDGSEIKVLDSYMGRYLQIPIQRIYQKPEHQGDNVLMADKWKNLDCKKIEVFRHYVDRDTLEERPAIETMILAEKKDWVEYPLAQSYTGNYACNCQYYTKVEVVLKDEEYSRRLFFDWNGTRSVYDFMEYCPDIIISEILENPEKFYASVEDENSNDPIIHLEFYSDSGEAVKIELEGERAIRDRIASIRVIEFTEKILD
jgi:phage pi2 protein 07